MSVLLQLSGDLLPAFPAAVLISVDFQVWKQSFQQSYSGAGAVLGDGLPSDKSVIQPYFSVLALCHLQTQFSHAVIGMAVICCK